MFWWGTRKWENISHEKEMAELQSFNLSVFPSIGTMERTIFHRFHQSLFLLINRHFLLLINRHFSLPTFNHKLSCYLFARFPFQVGPSF